MDGTNILIGGINASSAATDHTYLQFALNTTTRTRNNNNLKKVQLSFVTTQRKWWLACAAANDSAFVEYFPVSLGGAYSVAYGVPTWDAAGAIAAVSGAVVQLSSIQTEVSAVGTIAGDATGRAIVVSHTGVVLASSVPTLTFKYVHAASPVQSLAQLVRLVEHPWCVDGG